MSLLLHLLSVLTRNTRNTVVDLDTSSRFYQFFGAHTPHLGYLLPCYKCRTNGYLLHIPSDYCMVVLHSSVYLMVVGTNGLYPELLLHILEIDRFSVIVRPIRINHPYTKARIV